MTSILAVESIKGAVYGAIAGFVLGVFKLKMENSRLRDKIVLELATENSRLIDKINDLVKLNKTLAKDLIDKDLIYNDKIEESDDDSGYDTVH